MNVTEIIVPQQEVAWLPWAVQYFFFVGLAATAALLTGAAEFSRSNRLARLQAPALLVALTTGIVAPVALLGDLHQPGRFYHFYTDVTPWSWMSLGSIILPVFLVALLGYYALWQRDRFKANGAPQLLRFWTAGTWSGARLRMPLAAVMIASAIGILIYTGAEVMIVRARALWHTLWLIPNFALTALVASLAAIVFVQARIFASTPGDQRFAVRLFVGALALTGFGAAGWAIHGALAGTMSFTEFARLVSGFAYWQIVSGLSVVVGLGLLLAAAWMARTPYGVAHAWVLAPLALLAAWSFRWAVLMDVQSVPKYGAGLYPYEFPLGGDGLMGIIGTFGLWLTLIIVIASIMDARDPDGDTTLIPEANHG